MFIRQTAATLVAAASVAHAWLPWDRDMELFNTTARAVARGEHVKRFLPTTPMRGVNLGGWFVSEPWMLGSEWTDTMGCGGLTTCNSPSLGSEFDCMLTNYGNNVDGGNTAFQNHYKSWITHADIDQIKAWGLNTVRIPVGYWLYRDLVDSSEHFPDGGLPILEDIISYASSVGLFIILDLHGAPLGQKAGDPFVGQCPDAPNFFDGGYDRAEQWLGWATQLIHNNTDWNVGIIEVLNEPATADSVTDTERNTMVQTYYPAAVKAVRDAESSMNIDPAKKLHVQFMDDKWEQDQDGSFPSISTGNINDDSLAYDDHNYAAYAIKDQSQQGYMTYTCQNDRRNTDGDTPKFVQEWSLTVNDGSDQLAASDGNVGFFSDWFAAQQQLYEQDAQGWVFWTYKTSGLNDYRWDYSAAVAAGAIPNSADGLDANISNDVCSKYGVPRSS